MTHPLQGYIDAPLANATKINLPAGRSPLRRPKKSDVVDDIGGPKASAKELRERKAKAQQEKLSALFDYYAKTDLTAERVAEHMGLYRSEQTGTDKDGKPILSRALDTKLVETQLAWRRRAA